MHLKTLGRTLRTLGSFWLGERKAVAWKWLALVVATLVIINVLNIGISYGERAVMSSIQAKDQALFWHNLIVYGLTLMTGTPIVGMLGWFKGKLHVNWRDYLSRSLLKKYFDNDRFLDINNDSRVTNPEQRIQQDANIVSDKLMTFALALVDSFMALVSFITILWFLSPTLVVTAVVYASIGTYISYKFGKRLIGLHFAQETLEADLRKVLIWAGKNATPIASYRGAARELDTVNEQLRLTLSNWNQVLSWNRNLTLFKVGYDYLILIVPLVITAPLFFTGHMDMGGIVQAGTSFGRVLGALSVFVSQIMLFAELSAGAQRLVSFEDVLNQHHEGRIENGIKTEIAEGVLVRDLAVKTPDGNSTIIANVNFRVNPGERILIVGPSGIGKSTILKALAGQRKTGSGLVARPTADDVMYLPQVPYMPPGTLRDQLLYPGRKQEPADQDLLDLLKVLGLEDLVQREGGLDAVQDWDNGISGGQQQRIAIARVLIARPKLLILDEATSGLDEENEALVYELISASGITTVSVAHREGVVKYSDKVLVIRKGGSSRLVTAAKYKWSQAA